MGRNYPFELLILGIFIDQVPYLKFKANIAGKLDKSCFHIHFALAKTRDAARSSHPESSNIYTQANGQVSIMNNR